MVSESAANMVRGGEISRSAAGGGGGFAAIMRLSGSLRPLQNPQMWMQFKA
ncbi:hypothetical protein HMPREF9371_0970 [Neisseria shayeganii 871]|uniref:Uncharacterized protein n=1 Tax=Neisseria shayeganii 871 TaxID=1032488 RepID=G4CH81_9NEIS|nr:hypothetical protein HMPREF9371_0970 [Neisseria shayeganii 871]